MDPWPREKREKVEMAETVPTYRHRLYGQYLAVSGAKDRVLDETYYNNWARVAHGHFGRFFPSDKDARILDLGCGHGTMLHTLKTLGYRNLQGVDCSEEQIEQARKVHPHVVQADALDYLKAHPGEFDVVIAVDLVEHFNRDEALLLLELCHHALAPGGRVLLQLPNGDCPSWTSKRGVGSGPRGLLHAQQPVSDLEDGRLSERTLFPGRTGATRVLQRRALACLERDRGGHGLLRPRRNG